MSPNCDAQYWAWSMSVVSVHCGIVKVRATRAAGPSCAGRSVLLCPTTQTLPSSLGGRKSDKTAGQRPMYQPCQDKTAGQSVLYQVKVFLSNFYACQRITMQSSDIRHQTTSPASVLPGNSQVWVFHRLWKTCGKLFHMWITCPQVIHRLWTGWVTALFHLRTSVRNTEFPLPTPVGHRLLAITKATRTPRSPDLTQRRRIMIGCLHAPHH